MAAALPPGVREYEVRSFSEVAAYISYEKKLSSDSQYAGGLTKSDVWATSTLGAFQRPSGPIRCIRTNWLGTDILSIRK